MMNRNKRGHRPRPQDRGRRRGAAPARAKADVLVENFGPGAMERLGFGYEDLQQAQSRADLLLAVRASAAPGPTSDRRGFDLVAQAMSGIMSFTGDGPDGPPVKCGAAALRHHRRHPRRHGHPRGLRAPAEDRRRASGSRRRSSRRRWCRPTGSRRSRSRPASRRARWARRIRSTRPTRRSRPSDGWIVVGGANQTNWLRMLDALGAPELASDPRFAHNAGPHGAI